MNTIPIAMIERVEVLREGASAVYGSDAVAGVINIITRRDFFLGEFQCLGSSAPPWGAYDVPGLGQVTLGPDYQGGDIIAPDGTPCKLFDFFGGDSYNFAPVNHSRVPNRRWIRTFQGQRQADFLPGALAAQ